MAKESYASKVAKKQEQVDAIRGKKYAKDYERRRKELLYVIDANKSLLKAANKEDKKILYRDRIKRSEKKLKLMGENEEQHFKSKVYWNKIIEEENKKSAGK